jgi:hypothetical protein
MSNEPSANDSARIHVLQMIEDGKITAAEGMRLLNAMSGAGPAAPEPGGTPPGEAAPPAGAEALPPEPPPAAPQNPRPDFGRWQSWWQIPFWIGLGITLLGSGLMYWAYTTTRLSFWFFCASMPFAFGVLVLALAAATRTAKWIHVRVKTGEKRPKHIAISLPLPIGLTAWFFRAFGPFIPKLRHTGVDELILALGESATPENPLYVEVDEGDGEEKVQVYIG